MGEQRQRQSYSQQTRLRAGEMYVHQRMTLGEISKSLEIPLGTLGRWKTEDTWEQDLQDYASESFAQTREYLMRTIRRLSQRLFESTIPPDNHEEEFNLPDENLELRINRLSLALERIMPMGTLLITKQRIDIAKEIKQHGFDCVSRKIFTDQEMMTAFRVIEHYLDSLEFGKKK